MGNSEILALAINRLPLLRSREKLLLLTHLLDDGGLERLLRMSAADLAGFLGRPLRGSSWNPQEALRRAEGDLRDLTRAGFVCTFYWERGFPSLLREIYDPPVVLFWRGILPAPDRALVAIVGTRRPTGVARERARELGFGLGLAGIGTVSGLARGIDSEAQAGSVEAGGYTVGILGNGIDTVCPRSSRPLARKILERGGALASEYPPGIPPDAYHFPARNRIISAMARAVVVVQAPARSGALITAEHALEQNRDLVVHAVGLCGEAGRGSRGLWLDGATVVRTAADVVRLWEPTSQPHRGAGQGRQYRQAG